MDVVLSTVSPGRQGVPCWLLLRHVQHHTIPAPGSGEDEASEPRAECCGGHQVSLAVSFSQPTLENILSIDRDTYLVVYYHSKVASEVG